MPYCTLDDIKALVSEAELVQLTDDEGMGEIDVAKVNAAISRADEFIDGFLRGRYTLPLVEPIPALIKAISADLAVFYLHERRLGLKMPESLEERYKRALVALDKIQNGTITLGTASGDTPTPGEYKTNKSAQDKVFKQELLDKMP